MRLQWEILLFLFVLNLAFGIAISLDVPGTLYVKAAYENVTPEEYEAHFNATSIASTWDYGPLTGIPMFGDIFGGFNFLWQNIKYLIDGFPALLNYIDTSFITSSEGHTAFLIIVNALRAVYALLITMFLIEFISGRIFTD